MAERPVRRRISSAPAPTPDPSRRPTERRDVVRPETRHAVLVVIVLTVAAVLLLAVFGWADTFGNHISDALGTLVGWQRYLVPFYGLWLGIILLFPERFHITPARWIGFSLTLLGSLGLSHFFVPLSDDVNRAISGSGGGYIGLIVSHPLRASLGPWAAGLILAALTTIGLLILFNATLQSLYRQSNGLSALVLFIRRFRWRRRLATIQAETVTPPDFTTNEVPATEDGEEEAEGPDDESAEPEYVPLPARRRNVQNAKSRSRSTYLI